MPLPERERRLLWIVSCAVVWSGVASVLGRGRWYCWWSCVCCRCRCCCCWRWLATEFACPMYSRSRRMMLSTRWRQSRSRRRCHCLHWKWHQRSTLTATTATVERQWQHLHSLCDTATPRYQRRSSETKKNMSARCQADKLYGRPPGAAQP